MVVSTKEEFLMDNRTRQARLDNAATGLAGLGNSGAVGDAQWLHSTANSSLLAQIVAERSSGITPDYWSRDVVEWLGLIAVVQHGRIAVSSDCRGGSLAGRWSRLEQQITVASEQEHSGSTSLRSDCRLKLTPKH
ncbi:hypothetical protein NL676_034530 [Syzygium grande]|nr:hypothetical protein NL676_039489 [Syzygium grande]KAI6680649.1 hypothetical protein NL676_034530 [Syzygium grande]